MSENVTHAVFEVSLWSLVLSALEELFFFPLRRKSFGRLCGKNLWDGGHMEECDENSCYTYIFNSLSVQHFRPIDPLEQTRYAFSRKN